MIRGDWGRQLRGQRSPRAQAFPAPAPLPAHPCGPPALPPQAKARPKSSIASGVQTGTTRVSQSHWFSLTASATSDFTERIMSVNQSFACFMRFDSATCPRSREERPASLFSSPLSKRGAISSFKGSSLRSWGPEAGTFCLALTTKEVVETSASSKESPTLSQQVRSEGTPQFPSFLLYSLDLQVSRGYR